MQDKGYLLVNVQLPDAASRRADRAASCTASRRSPATERTGRGAHGGRRRAIDPAGRQRAELRRHVRDARRLPRPRRRAASPARPSPPACKSDFQDEIAGRPGQRLRRPAGRRPGHRRRIQDHHRGPRRQRPPAPCSRPARRSSSRETQRPGCKGSSAASAPTPPGCSSTSTATQAKMMGVSLSELFNTAPGLSRLALRQRLQPLRPHLAGQRPGRRRFPQAGERPQAAEDPQRGGRRWSRWAPWPPSATSPAR